MYCTTEKRKFKEPLSISSLLHRSSITLGVCFYTQRLGDRRWDITSEKLHLL